MKNENKSGVKNIKVAVIVHGKRIMVEERDDGSRGLPTINIAEGQCPHEAFFNQMGKVSEHREVIPVVDFVQSQSGSSAGVLRLGYEDFWHEFMRKGWLRKLGKVVSVPLEEAADEIVEIWQPIPCTAT